MFHDKEPRLLLEAKEKHWKILRRNMKWPNLLFRIIILVTVKKIDWEERCQVIERLGN